MYIKEIEFVNFKSFGKKVKIPFYNDFTTISGPNGSGKSNIIDGILFALGLTSSRTLRAEKLTDLIYNGDTAKKPNFAQVTIRFDNSDRKLPIELDEIKKGSADKKRVLQLFLSQWEIRKSWRNPFSACKSRSNS